MSTKLSSWSEIEGYPLVCARCGRQITRRTEVGVQGTRLDDKGRVVEKFLRCSECVVRRHRPKEAA